MPAELPRNFQGAPARTPARPAPPRPARLVEVAPGLPRSVPTITFYEGQPANLNGEATALLSPLGTSVCLHAPAPHRPGRRANLWQLAIQPGRPLLARPDRGNLRWRTGDDHPPPGRYLLTPLAGYRNRFSLVPQP